MLPVVVISPSGSLPAIFTSTPTEVLHWLSCIQNPREGHEAGKGRLFDGPNGACLFVLSLPQVCIWRIAIGLQPRRATIGLERLTKEVDR